MRRAENQDDWAINTAREATVTRLDRFLKTITTEIGGPTARLCRSVLSGVMGLDVRHGAAATNPVEPVVSQQVHEGYEWIYVIRGRLRLVLGEHDLVLPAGEAAEFDTRTPHWFGRADARSVEFLSLFGPQGQRMHVRARTTR